MGMGRRTAAGHNAAVSPSARSTLTKALGGAAVAALFLLLAEGALALLGLPDPGLVEGDLAAVWWPRPNLDRVVPFPEEGSEFHVHTDPHGLRGAGPPPSGPWTLALGCSTTFGWGVEDEEAWPARLAALTGRSVVNGGVPGWSTEQARRGVQRWLDLGPDQLILAYIVRDATPAPLTDALAPPTPWLLRTHLARLLRPTTRAGSRPGGATFRVPPDRFRENLRALVALAAPAKVHLMAFPQVAPSTEWVAAMESVGPTWTPSLPREDFFAHDPIHLNPEGHAELARWIAGQSD